MTLLYPLFEKGVSLFLQNPGGQSVGFIAMFIIFYAFSIKDDTKLIKILTLSNIVWFVHFFLLANYGAMIATFVAIIRLFLSLRYKKNISVLAFVASLSIIFGYFSYEGYISLIPIISTIIASYGFFYLEKIPLRILLLGISTSWLYYHTQTGSISGMINESIVLGTLCLTIYRFIYEREKYSYDLESGKVSLKKRFLLSLKKKPYKRKRLNLGRFMYLRDKDRFENPQ